MDGVEDIVRANTVLEVVHQEEDNAFQVDVEHDDQVELCHFGECEQISATPEKGKKAPRC